MAYTTFEVNMSIKKILLFVLLLLAAYIGVYITVFGIKGYLMYWGTERDLNIMNPGELQRNLNVKGSVETTLGELGRDHITNSVFGIPVGKNTLRYYFLIPLGYEEDIKEQKYAVLAADRPEDVELLKSLDKSLPAPLDPNAPRFEFSGIVMDITPTIRTNMYNKLWEIYDTEFNIYTHKNVNGNLIPYTIYVKSGEERGNLTAIIVGGAVTLASLTAFIILAVATYKKKHRYY